MVVYIGLTRGESVFSFLNGWVGTLYILLTFFKKCMDFWNDFLISNYRSITKIKRTMLNVLKAFLGIIVSCIGIGFSIGLSEFFGTMLATVFVMSDLVAVFFVLKFSKSDLFGVFCTFCPSLAFAEVIRENIFIAGLEARALLISLEYTFTLVLIGLLILSVVLSLRKKRISIRDWGWVFSSSFSFL